MNLSLCQRGLADHCSNLPPAGVGPLGCTQDTAEERQAAGHAPACWGSLQVYIKLPYQADCMCVYTQCAIRMSSIV